MKRISFCLLGFLLGFAHDAFADAAFYGKEWMIQNAEVIAIVEIARVEPAQVKGQHWTYREAAPARVERTLKGELPKDVVLHGGEDFICAQVRYKPGRHLVFLTRDGKLLTGVNWHLGVRPITGDKVEWFGDGDANIHQSKPALLSDVVKEIEAAVRKRVAP